jgi:hypothetical protein
MIQSWEAFPESRAIAKQLFIKRIYAANVFEQ